MTMKLGEIINRIFFLIRKDYFITFPYIILALLIFLVSALMEKLKIPGNQPVFGFSMLALVLAIWLLDMAAQIATMKMTQLLERGENVSLKACFSECLKKIWPFMFAAVFSQFLVLAGGFGISQYFYFKPALMPAVFFMTMVIINLLMVFWPAALVVEATGPLSSFKYNFIKMNQTPGQFINLAVFFLFLQLVGFFLSAQLSLVKVVGPVLSFVFMGLTMALLAMLRIIGYLNLGKK